MLESVVGAVKGWLFAGMEANRKVEAIAEKMEDQMDRVESLEDNVQALRLELSAHMSNAQNAQIEIINRVGNELKAVDTRIDQISIQVARVEAVTQRTAEMTSQFMRSLADLTALVDKLRSFYPSLANQVAERKEGEVSTQQEIKALAAGLQDLKLEVARIGSSVIPRC